MNNRSKRRYEIACIFFCEFHDKIGYKIVHQCPPDFIKKEQFRKISPFILPNQKECYTLSALKLGELCLVGCPIFLENTLYDRNSYLFNLGILLSRKAYIENYRFYDLLVEKLNKKFEKIEVVEKFDFIKKNNDLLKTFIDQLYSSISEGKDEIIIKLNYNNQKIFDFSVKFQDCSQIGVTIQNSHVPIWIEKMPKDYEMKVEKDFIKVIQLVDGINTIVNINEKSGIPIEKINIVVYNLLNKNLIILNEAIKFTDTYRAKYNLRNFDKKNLYQKYQLLCNYNTQFTKENFETIQLVKNQVEDPNIFINDTIIFNLICQLTNSKNLKHFLENSDLRGINVFFLIHLAFYNNLIIKIKPKK